MKATPDEHETRWQLLRRERFARDAAVFVPRRLIADDGSVDLSGFMAEVNAIVATRGMVLADGQVIATPFSDRIGYELFGDDSVFDTPPVLPAPLEFPPRVALTADDWIALFGPEGSRRHEVVDLALVDFRDVEN